MPLQNTWVTALNQVPADQSTLTLQSANLLYQLKLIYIAAGWTLEGCADGATVGAAMGNPNGDLITGAAAFVWNVNTSAHSQMIFKSPATWGPDSSKRVWHSYATDYAPGSEYKLSVTHSDSAPTGGSKTANVTQTGHSHILSVGTSNAWINSSGANAHFHTMYDDKGNFLFFVSRDGSGFPQTAVGAIRAEGFEATDPYAQINFAGYLNSGCGVFARNLTSANKTTFFTDGALLTISGWADLYVDAFSVLDAYTTAGSNISADYPKVPVILGCADASKTTIRGSLIDIFLAPGAASTNTLQGREIPASGPTEWAIFGQFWVPNGGVAPSF